MLGVLPAFALEDQTGAPVTAERFAGQVCIINTFLVCCPGKCPDMARAVKHLIQSTPGEADLQFLSISSNPEAETTKDLLRYATEWGADPHRWTFARGTKSATQALLFQGLRVDGDPDNPVNHSFRLVLVDRSGNIRGYYRSLESAETERLLRDARRLLAEPAIRSL